MGDGKSSSIQTDDTKSKQIRKLEKMEPRVFNRNKGVKKIKLTNGKGQGNQTSAKKKHLKKDV